MKLLIATLALAALLPAAAMAQPKAAPACPRISVDGPSDVVPAGGTLVFSANVNADVDITYNWSISSGAIQSGQGTPQITVGEVPPDNTSTATVEIGGLDPSCTAWGSTTAIVGPK